MNARRINEEVKKEKDKEFDTVFKNGIVINGTGNPGFKADIGIKGDTIKRIGSIDPSRANSVIDVSGEVISPGFIDVHSHSDLTLLVDPRARNAIKQGVTTDVIGNCGFSGGPVGEGKEELYKDYMIGYQPGLVIDWVSFGDYLDKLREKGTAINVAPLVGHGTIRLAVMGFDIHQPTKENLTKMKGMVKEAMQEGAFGISTGLIYPPGSSADTEEVIELCKVVANYGGFYNTHVRNEGSNLIESVEEAIRISKTANLPLHLSHHHCKFPGLGKNKGTLMMVDEAIENGLEVSMDLHTYMMGNTPLFGLLPYWAFEGGKEDLARRLKDKKIRQRIKEDMRKNTGNAMIEQLNYGYANKVIVENAPNNPEFENRDFGDIAREKGTDPFDAVIDILLSEISNVSSVYIRAWIYGKEDLYNVLQHHTSMIGADGVIGATDGPLAGFRFHPRTYGTFPRLFRKFVREEKFLTIEETVRKMTSCPAQLLRLKDRGLVLEGMKADIVIFNPKTITDKSTYENPNQYAEGVEHVLVNGKFVIKEGDFTDKLPGAILQRQ